MSLPDDFSGEAVAVGTGLPASLAPFEIVGGASDRGATGTLRRGDATPAPAPAPSAASAVSRDPARLRAVQPDDLPAIWRFCSRSYPLYRGFSWDDFNSVWHHRWWLNPARTPEHPLGWLVESSTSEVVGFGAYVPMPLKIGPKSVVALCTANWVVNPAYRRHSLAMFRKYVADGQRHTLLTTGASPTVAKIHANTHAGMEAIPVDGIDQHLSWIIDPRRFLAWKLEQLGEAHAMWRRLASTPGLGALGAVWPIALGIWTDPERRFLRWLAKARIAFDCPRLAVERLTWFGEEFDDLWDAHGRCYDVMVERSSKFLNWRHFLFPKSVGECFAFGCRDGGRLVGYVVLQRPGYRDRLPGCLVVTDLFYPPERDDVLGNLMNAAFRFAVEQRASVLTLCGFHPTVRAALAGQRPLVLSRDRSGGASVLERLRRRILAALGSGGRLAAPGNPSPPASYWYRVPDPELAEICRKGSWWPSGIDGTANL